MQLRLRPVLPLLAASFLAACSTAQVRLPVGFQAQAESHAVSGHSPRRFNQPLRFGPYSALEMREGSAFSWGIPVAGVEVGRASRPYAFTLVATGQAPVPVQCRSRTWGIGRGAAARRTSIDATALAGPLLACGLRFDDGPPLPLELSARGVRFEGRLVAPWREYAVRSLHGIDGSALTASEPTGFEILREGTPVLVVDLLNGGRVHLDRGLRDEEAVYLAAAAAALLMLDLGAVELDG
jgi:hypothetical protein